MFYILIYQDWSNSLVFRLLKLCLTFCPIFYTLHWLYICMNPRLEWQGCFGVRSQFHLCVLSRAILLYVIILNLIVKHYWKYALRKTTCGLVLECPFGFTTNSEDTVCEPCPSNFTDTDAYTNVPVLKMRGISNRHANICIIMTDIFHLRLCLNIWAFVWTRDE